MNILNYLINKYFKSNKNTIKHNRRKSVLYEKDCIVSYHPELLFLMNYPGEYVEFEEI